MTLLFESSWNGENYTTMERLYCTETKQIIVRQVQDDSPEYFLETYSGNPRAHYSSILDQSIKLEKQNRPKKGMNLEYGFQGALYKNIRENYWNRDNTKTKYNKNPNYWNLDIETRSGVSYKNYGSEALVKIRKRNETAERIQTINELRGEFKDYDVEKYQYYSESSQEWESLHTAKFMERNTGFPVPQHAREEITLIQIYDKHLDSIVKFGIGENVYEEEYKDILHAKYTDKRGVKNVKYVNCRDERHLIDNYLKFFKMRDPLTIFAWKGADFDFAYIRNRLVKLGYSKDAMSNHGKVSYKEGEFKGQITFKVNAQGNHYVDLAQVYDKFIFKPTASLALDYIAEVELDEHKVDHSEYMRFDDFYLGNYDIPLNPTELQKDSKIYKAAIAGNIQEVRERTYSLFCYYGDMDVLLMELILRKHLFHNVMINVTSKTGVTMSDAMGTVAPWSHFLSNVLYSRGLVMPKKQEHNHAKITGGFVREPIKGKHRWVVSEDYSSMYPLVSMVGFNMSPETYVSKMDMPDELRDLVLTYYPDQNEDDRFNIPQEVTEHIASLLRKYKLSMGINGALFKQDKLGVIPELILEIYEGRAADKKTMQAYDKCQLTFAKLLVGDVTYSEGIDDTYQQIANIVKNAPTEMLNYKAEELREASKFWTKDDIMTLLSESEDYSAEFSTAEKTAKVLMNGLYGCIASDFFILFNPEIAGAITGGGRYIVKRFANYVEVDLQGRHPSNDPYVVGGDTDSIYFHIAPFMDNYIAKNPNKDMNHYVDVADAFEKKVIAPISQRCIDDFARDLNAYNPSVIGCDREIISDCLLPNTMITLKDGNNNNDTTKVKSMRMSAIANKYGINTSSKVPEVVDVSNLNLTVASYDEVAGKYVEGKVLNIQKKITSKRILELYHEDGTKIHCTEDHKIAINVEGEVVWKEAKNITEDDDVMTENFGVN